MTDSEKNIIRIMIAEDQGLIRHSLTSLLDKIDDFQVVGSVSNGEELLQRYKEATPDIIIMDIRMPRVNGLEVTRIVHKESPGIKILALSSYDHPVFIREIIRAGASGFLTKNCSFEELCDGLRLVSEGKTYLSKSIGTSLLENLNPEEEVESPEGNSLTTREVQIIRLLSEGFTTKEIAGQLFISPKTVERHKTNILKKLKLKNTYQLIKVSIDRGIILP